MRPRLLDRDRLAKLLELAGHPSSNETEALNALRAARALLDRAGSSLAGLLEPGGTTGGDCEPLSRELDRLRAENAALRGEAAKLRRANSRLRELNLELEADAGDAQPAPADEASSAMIRLSPSLVAVFDLLSEWRSIADLTERLGAEISAARVKRLVRQLDDHGLLRIVEAWPTRYKLRPEGELSERAKALRTRIEDAKLEASAAGP